MLCSVTPQPRSDRNAFAVNSSLSYVSSEGVNVLTFRNRSPVLGTKHLEFEWFVPTTGLRS